jgi:HSP20 family protein
MIRDMRHRVSGPLPSETAPFGEEIREIFRDLGHTFGAESLAGQCSPPVDVYERDAAVEIVIDLPGVDPSAVRIIAKGDAVLVIGEKIARRPRPESSFHLVERDFGRFARAIRLDGACDTSRAQARLANGELHITFPKIADRRGQTFQIPIAARSTT